MMGDTYQLVFSNQTTILPELKQHVEGITFIQSNTDKEILICVRQERKLIGYTYSKVGENWLHHWNETVFNNEGKYPLDRYPWLSADKLLPDRNVVVIYHPDGVRFYEIDLSTPGLKLLAEDGNFHEVYGWSAPDHILLFGSFYPNLNETGVLSRNDRGEIRFYAATKESFLPDESDPLFVLDNELSLTPDWNAASTDIFVTNLLHRGPSVIGLRTTSGLEFYQFDANYLLQRIAKTTQITKSLQNNVSLDSLFFADLTHQLYQDILHLNSSGLYVYQYNNSEQDYTFLNRDTEFTQSNGWLPRHSDSVILADINDDSRDDLIFTGPQGLTALTFDVRSSGWKMLINPNHFSGTQRYATVVGTLPAIPPAIPQPSMFTQDTNGNLQWAKVVPAPVTATTVVSRETTPSPSQEPYHRNNHHTIPEQITRTTLTEKPILRLAEQWENNFFKDMVDTASGQVRFSLPLIDISSATGWALQLELFYNSQASTSELLGEGWSIPLAQDYIVVDHRGSIYPVDAHYYLVLQGRHNRLSILPSEVGIQRFELAEAANNQSMTIEYYPAEQRWVIEGPSEQVFYGTANQGSAKNALQWSLGWPNWRGPGRAKEQLQPLVIAWFLNSRVAKHSNRTLYYDYEQDTVAIAPGKTYTAALRLKTICDYRQLRFVLDYAAKPKDEYNNPNPIDDKGDVVFPVALAQSHYLQGYNLTTADYTQTLQFIYQIDHGKRLLTAIQQPFISHHEVVLEFSYQRLLEKQVISSCSFPSGVTVNLSYETVTTPTVNPVHEYVLSYPIREKPKIAYGSDYAIMAYRDLIPTAAGKVILRIMNREMTKIIKECYGNEKFLCPTVQSEIEDFTLQAYRDYFVVLIQSKQSRVLHFFERREGIWVSENSLTKTFSKAALIRFSDVLVVVSDPNERNLTLFERLDNQSGWATIANIPLNTPLTRLAVHNRLVVGFDDHQQLWLFHRDSTSTWKRDSIEAGVSGFEKVLERFDLNPETQQRLLEVLNHNGLQIFNNFILLNSIHENSGQLNQQIHLFLLEDQCKVMQNKTVNLPQENLFQLSYNHEVEGSNYTLVYFKEDNRFKIKVKSISGDVVKGIEEIGNKNKKLDEMEKKIKELNESDGWKNFFRTMFLFKLQSNFIQISQQGAYCGNDTFLRITGTDWERESLPIIQPIPLGGHFVLKPSDDNKMFKLYSKDGSLLRELKLHSPGQLANRYPAYIAFQTTEDSVRVLTFKDERTVGQLHTLNHEQLLLESNWQNLVTVANASATTVHTEPQECRIRSLFMLTTSDKPKLFVSQLGLTDGEIQRLTGYQHKFGTDQSGLTNSETVIVTPAANKSRSGWYEAKRSYQVRSGNVTTTEQWFDAEGKPVLAPLKQQSTAQTSNETNSTTTASLTQLFDREGKWLISDFSPYNLADEMVAYYGFESYEINQIGAPGSTAKAWRLVDTKVVEKGFTFTGENYLQLNHTGFLEGTLEPRDQTITYLASCWLRCATPLIINTPTSHFKAIISTTTGQKIIGLKAQIKRQSGDWSYLELPIDLLLVKKIYQDFYHFSNETANISPSVITLPSPEKAKFRITLRVQTVETMKIIDLDNIRFSPLTLDFKATVCHPVSGQTTAILQANGLVTKTLYNRLQQDIAGLQEDGQLERFTSSSYTGKLAPTPVGIITNHIMPVTLTFEPEEGFYESFDAYALRNRWQVDSPDAWNIAPGQLWHGQSGKNRIHASSSLFHSRTAAFRCYFALQETQASLSLDWKGAGSIQLTRNSGGFATLAVTNGQSFSPFPVAGELIIMLDNNFVWLWLDSVLLLEQTISISISDVSNEPYSAFSLEAQGQVLIEDCLVMNNPQLRIEYNNAFGEKTQVIQLADANTVLVTDTLYDELGREAITSKTTRVLRTAGEPLLAYRPHFASNKNPADPESVWQTGKLRGEVDRLNPDDQGVAYARTEYAKNPLNEKSALGFAGPEFSVTGHYATRYSHNSGIALLDNLFPAHKGYRQTVEYKPNGSQKVAVFDQRGNQVASYVQVPSYNHLLSTYEYDTENRLVKSLSPMYHEKVDTAGKITSWHSEIPSLSTQELHWQQALATFFIYDDNGNLIRKITPDSGTTEYLYNAVGQKRFMVSIGPNNQTSLITYFNYDVNDQLVETGCIKEPISLAALRQYAESPLLTDYREYQRIDYADDHPDPWSRGRIKRFITNNEDNPVVEELSFNAQQQIVAKSTVSTLVPADANDLTQFTKQYIGSQLQTLTYPVVVNGEPFSLVHSTNRLGQLVELGTKDEPARFARFTYNPNGHLETELYQPETPYQFTRNYRYNSPGFLEEISDPFLTEGIAYTKKGYGQPGYGDGMVMETAFNASWPATADGRWFQIEEKDLGGNYSALCINALQRTGYLKNNNQPVKLYLQETETSLPLICDRQSIARRVAEKQIPRYYGHRYAYGNHQELVKAKYFTDETVSFIDPLQPISFSKEIPLLTSKQSKHIWQLLTNARYIIADQQRYDDATAIGKPGISLFRDSELLADLKLLNDRYTLYAGPIQQLVMAAIGQQSVLSLDAFVETFLHWQGLNHSSPRIAFNLQKTVAEEIGKMMVTKYFLPTQPSDIAKVLDKKIVAILADYSNFVPDIVRVLSQRFSHALGTTAFDVQSFKIDANGNHHLFYTGFNRYEFTYPHASNQIRSIKLDWDTLSGPAKVFEMQHDAQGNVIQALHRGIQTIEYHPTSQRTTRIQLTDGRTLLFYYDAQGERVLKRVLTATGEVSHETFYLRDEKGRVLVDQRLSYFPSQPTQKIITVYLYGPRGLLGFIRNNDFYSVMTDHAGSIRLVIQSGRVVAAYDYLPYGELMRSFGSDPQVQVMYRFTGQEWDEETGLYNYHARLYDPSIGRFYQPDPQSQYFSPYKYAGNSPVSLIDPDGELSYMLFFGVIGALAGIYLGGAAANNRWNPADWDVKDSGTWIGIVGGALAGGLLPVGFVASASSTIGIKGTIFLGLVGAYLTMAAANQDFKPQKWKWDRPHTFNALFQGFGSGAGFFGGIGMAHNYASHFSLLGKRIFLSVSYFTGGALAYAGGVVANKGEIAFWKWDPSNPATWSGLVDGFDSGMGWPQSLREIGRGIGKLIKNPAKLGSLLGKEASKRQKLFSILKNPKHPLYKASGTVVMAYFRGSSANENGDITSWNWKSWSTYEGVINGVFFGKDTSGMLKFAQASKTKNPPNKLIPKIKNSLKVWRRNFIQLLDSIQFSRKNKEYLRLMDHAFSSDTWRSKLLDKTVSLKGEINNFFKLGLEQWKNGNVNPPEVFRKLLLGEAEQNVRGSSRKLIEWQQESEQLSKRRREIFPDDDEANFLSCRRSSRRRKRSSGPSYGCLFSQTTEETPDVMDLLLHSNLAANNIFKDNFNMLLDSTPNTQAATRPIFFQGLLLGASLLNKSKEVRTFVKTTSSGVTLAIYSKSGTNEKLKLITFDIAHVKTLPDGKSANALPEGNSANAQPDGNSANTLPDGNSANAQPDGNSANAQPDGNSVNALPDGNSVKTKESDLNQIFEALLTTKENVEIENIKYLVPYGSPDSNEKNQLPPDANESGFIENIKPTDVDFIKSLNDIKSNKIDNVKEGAENLFKDLIKVYKVNENQFSVLSEAMFHGFVYGALSLNYKNTYDLNIYVERHLGRGTADLIFLSRSGENNNNKNWQAVPIVVEFKADKTSAAKALDQITNKGYLYNLSMRTVAQKAVIVSVNPLKGEVVAKIVDIPKYEGFTDQLTSKDGIFINKIKEQLEYLCNSISPLAFKNPKENISLNMFGEYNKNMNYYLSRMILGELLSKSGLKIQVLESGKESLITFILKKEGVKPIILNILEGIDHPETHVIDKLIKLDSDDASSFNRIDIRHVGGKNVELEINPIPQLTQPSSKRDSPKRQRTQTEFLLHSYRDVYSKSAAVKNKNVIVDSDPNPKRHNDKDDSSNKKSGTDSDSDSVSIPEDKMKYAQVDHINIENIFDGNKAALESELNKLSTVKDIIRSEAHYQAILHGLLLGNHEKTLSDGLKQVIQVYPEANLSREGRSDLIIRKLIKDGDTLLAESIVLLELKYSSSGEKTDITNKINEGTEQLNKYSKNLDSVTDSDKCKAVVLVYNKDSGKTEASEPIDINIAHSSRTPAGNDKTLSESKDINIVDSSQIPAGNDKTPSDSKDNNVAQIPAGNDKTPSESKDNNVAQIPAGNDKTPSESKKKRIRIDENGDRPSGSIKMPKKGSRNRRFVQIISNSLNQGKKEKTPHKLDDVPISISSGDKSRQIWPIELIKSIRSTFLTYANLKVNPTDNSTCADLCGQTFSSNTLDVGHSHRHRDGLPRAKPLASGASQNKPWTSTLINQVATLLGGVHWEWSLLFSSRESSATHKPAILGLGFDQSTSQVPQGLQAAEQYTACHLHGGLQLADLVIRKITGENYQRSVAKVDPLAEAEARLPASLRQEWANISSDDGPAADPYRGYRV